MILVDTHASTTGTRLAARFPATAVYAWDQNAHGAEDSSQILGMLQTYGLALETHEGQVQDAWERATRLIHGRYVATVDRGAAVPGGDAVGRAQRVLPRVEPTSGAQRPVDGRTDRGTHLKHLGQPADAAPLRARHGRRAATGTSVRDNIFRDTYEPYAEFHPPAEAHLQDGGDG